MDPRDPRSQTTWPCFNHHQGRHWQGNLHGLWIHCEVCNGRLMYMPRVKSPSNSTQSLNHAMVSQMLAELEPLMRGHKPTQQICKAMMDKITAEVQRAGQPHCQDEVQSKAQGPGGLSTRRVVSFSGIDSMGTNLPGTDVFECERFETGGDGRCPVSTSSLNMTSSLISSTSQKSTKSSGMPSLEGGSRSLNKNMTSRTEADRTSNPSLQFSSSKKSSTARPLTSQMAARVMQMVALMTSSILSVALDISLDGRDALWEVACSENSWLSECANKHGLVSRRINYKNGFDIYQPSMWDHLHDLRRSKRPKMIWPSLPCTKWCNGSMSTTTLLRRKRCWRV